MRHFGLAAGLALTLLAGCQDRAVQWPTRANFTAAVTDYLAQRGHLCLGKYEWPIDVAEADGQAGGQQAQQMQALETLGLVTARDQAVRPASAGATPGPTGSVRRYALTAEGRKYYLQVPVVIRTATQQVTHPADFCVATLSLDRVIGWEAPRTVDGRTATSVLFSYRIDAPAWTATPTARRAFPLVRRAIDNAGTLQLRLGEHLTSKGWVADELSS